MKYTFKSGEGAISARSGRLTGVGPITRPPAPQSLGSAVSGPVSSVSGGGTVLGATVPVVYGYNKLKGYLSFVRREQEKLYMSWVYASGKLPQLLLNDNIDSVIFNGEKVDLVYGDVAGVKFEQRNGRVDGSIDGYIAQLGPEFQFNHPGMAMVTGLCEDTREAEIASLNLEVITDGRLFVDFRTPLGPETSNTNNVAVAWDILTSTWPWAGVLDPTTDSSNIDINYDQWLEWANWCDDTTVTPYDYVNRTPDLSRETALGTNRWAFNGIVRSTNHWAAADAVLYNAFLKIVHVDGKFMLRPETDVVPTSVYIPEGRFIGVPTISDAEPNTVPTEMEISYISKVDFSSCIIMYTHPSAKGKHVKLASTIYGCNSQKQAIRWAEQKTLLMRERWTVRMMCGPEVANVAPGGIVEAFLPYGFGDSFVRVMSIISKPEMGKYEISGRVMPGSVESIEIINEYSGEDTSGGWETGTPNAVQSFSLAVYSRMSSRDTYAPMINAAWTAPIDGPRPRFYELKQENTVIARVFGLKWSGPVMDTGGNVTFTVAAVGYNGLEGPTVPYSANLDLGHVSGLGGIPINGAGSDIDAGQYVFDDGIAEFVLRKHPHNYELHTLTMTAGLTAIGDHLLDSGNSVRSVNATLINDSVFIPVSTSFSGDYFAVNIENPNAVDLYFSVWVGIDNTSEASGGDIGVDMPSEVS